MEKYVVDLIFVFGQQDTTKMSKIDYDIWNREREVFGDFLIGDFVDSYSNLPLKLWVEILLFTDTCNRYMFIIILLYFIQSSALKFNPLKCNNTP